MYYIQRDTEGNVLRLEATPFEGMDDMLAVDHPHAKHWLDNQAIERTLLNLRQTDQEMIRVLEDLITTLIDNGLLRFTDLPPAAQAKLIERNKVRDALGLANRLIDDDEDAGPV